MHKNQELKKRSYLIAMVLAIYALGLIFSSEGSAQNVNRETPVVRAVRKVSPAVVNISSVYEVRKRTGPFSGFGMNPFFEEFFKDFFDPRFERRQQYTSLGSGVIIDGKKGLILTNAHVIQKTGTIKVMLQDEREFEAKIVGADPDSDLAVLKIDSADQLPDVTMGNSDDLMIGETVIAIGNPFGFSHTVTTGVVSALDRSIRTEDRVYHDFIQIDASINPGNSGGPLLNLQGEVIGVNTAILAHGQGIGFAIPSNTAKSIIAILKEKGKVTRGMIGIVAQTVTPRIARKLGLARAGGVLVLKVDPNLPAQKAGIRSRDIIISYRGRPVQNVFDFIGRVADTPPGTVVEITVRRRGHEKKFKVKVGELTEKRRAQARRQPGFWQSLLPASLVRRATGGQGLSRSF
jgi:serine protease Do